MRRRCLASLFLCVVVATPSVSLGQNAAPAYPRPRLPVGADTADWLSYFQHGLRHLDERATESRAGFWWATRLAPSRAEPLYGQWAAILVAQPVTVIRNYLRDRPKTLQRPEIVEADSLRDLALMRNPFVHRAADLRVVTRVPGFFGVDAPTRGWRYYSDGRFDDAATVYTDLITVSPRRALEWRFRLALAEIGRRQYEAGLRQLLVLLDTARATEALSRQYDAKDQLLYMIGRIHLHLGRIDSARASFGAAIVENAAFAYGHLGLAAAAQSAGRSDEAVEALRLAVELAPTDPVLRFELGRALGLVGASEEAMQTYRVVIRLEPWFAEPHLALALEADARGDIAEARRSYSRFLELASRDDPLVLTTRARLAALAPPAP